MSAVNKRGVIATAVAGGGLVNKQGQGMVDARMKVSSDTYTTDGTEGIGSLITMGPILPEGAIIKDVEIVYGAMGASATMSVGDVNSAARYQSATDVSAAGKAGCTLVAGIEYEIGTNTGDNQIVITTAGATLASGKVLQVNVEYAFD